MSHTQHLQALATILKSKYNKEDPNKEASEMETQPNNDHLVEVVFYTLIVFKLHS